MEIIVFTDIHGRIDLVGNIGDEIEKADLVLIAGDVTHFGAQNEARSIIDAIRPYCKKILAVPGNCDMPEVEHYLENEGINLHAKNIRYGDINFIGLGGSLPCPGSTPNEFTEDEMENILSSVSKDIEPHQPLIFLSHQPPFETKNDMVRPNYHVGSVSIRRFIEKNQMLICFTGHIHEGKGIDNIGSTKIVNPGPFFTGTYAWAQINEQLESVEIRNIK